MISSYPRVLSSVDVRDVDESLDPGLASDLGEAPRAVNVDVVEGEVPALELATDEVEDHVGVSHGLPDGLLVAKVEGREEDLAEIAAETESANVHVVPTVWNDQL